MSKKHQDMSKLMEGVLTPLENQPYVIPENWLWVKFDNVMKTSSNKAKAIKQKEYESNGEIPVVDQGINLISGFTNNIDHLYTGEVPVIVFGDHTRCVKWIDFPFAQGADGTKLLKPLERLHSKYFYYLIQSIYIPDKGYSRHFKYLRESVLPLPPLEEQVRISEKIERLLGKVDEAKRLIDKAKETFELRRAAILNKAFSGELTRAWREENGEMLENWSIVELDKIAIAIDPQPSHRTPPISDDGVPYIGVKDCNYETQEIDFHNARPVSKTVLDEHLNRYSINNGDFIIGKIGTVGKPFIIPTDRNYTLSANVVLIQSKTEKVIPKYLYYLFQSRHIENQFNSGMNATSQPAFGLKKVRKLNVNLCSLNEQQRIVEILDVIFENETRAKKIMEEISQVDKLKNTILQKAFKGELGTNNPNDEAAIELLKSALQVKLN